MLVATIPGPKEELEPARLVAARLVESGTSGEGSITRTGSATVSPSTAWTGAPATGHNAMIAAAMTSDALTSRIEMGREMSDSGRE